MAPKARIFISYRRSDDLTMTGRIHDRLCTAFGEANVFKDMEDIPAGADFRVVLDQAIATSSIVLVIVGQKWLSVTDAQGNRRLDDPGDFVRAEVELALAHHDILLIPVLIDIAMMPSADQLPTSIKELAYRNAVTVRTDPDFSHDMDMLCAQIRAHVGIKKTQRRAINWPVVIAAAVLIILIAAGLLFVVRPALIPNSSPAQSVEVATLAPVPPDKYLVLVAKPEALRNPTPRDVARFITANLNNVLDDNTLFSETVTQQYNQVITTDAEAREVAYKFSAAVIIWGSYTDQDVTLNVQVGSLNGFTNMKFDRSTLEKTINVHVQMSDERTQSVAPQVLGILFALHAADDNVFDDNRIAAILSLLNVEPAKLIMDTNSALSHRGIEAYYSDPATARASFDQAVNGDPSNPLLYLVSAQLYLTQGDLDNARQANQSASSFNVQGWTLPLFQLAFINFADGKSDAAVANLNDIAKVYPKAWYPLYSRGVVYYLQGNYQLARTDIQNALALNPPASFPYYLGLVMAFRDGRLAEAQQLYAKTRHDFPDPTFGTRLIEVGLGKAAPPAFKEVFTLFGLLLLKDYPKLITESDAVLNSNMTNIGNLLASVNMLRGFAHCNLNDDKTAESDYTKALDYDPASVTSYMLRADVRNQLGNVLGAAADLIAAQSHNQSGSNLLPYIEANRSGQFTCKNAFDYSPPPATAAP